MLKSQKYLYSIEEVMRGKKIENGKVRRLKRQTFKYLGFTFNRMGNYKEHIKELVNKGRIAVRKIWGLGERLCRE